MFSGNTPPIATLVWCGLIAVLLARSIWVSVRALLRARVAESWPTAEGRIETCYVTTVSGGETNPTRYYPVLQYSYVVKSERYSGSFSLAEWNRDQDAAGEVGRGWVGDRIRVRYRPDDPGVSVWLLQDGAPAGPVLSLPDGSDNGMIDPELNK